MGRRRNVALVALGFCSLAQAMSAGPAGRPDRVELRFFADGTPASVRSYRDGRKTGWHLAFWPDGTPQSEAAYREDAYHGTYRSYYRSGRRYELRRFELGREAGRQQSWTEDGTLYLNYEVRDGRRYGLVNARPCLPVGPERP